MEIFGFQAFKLQNSRNSDSIQKYQFLVFQESMEEI